MLWPQHILNDWLLLVVTNWEKNNLSCGFKLELISNNNLPSIICCENVVKMLCT